MITSRPALGVLGVLGVSCLLGACATQPKSYLPPDNAKVQAATHQVKGDVAKSHEIARDARKLVTDAQRNADTIIVDSIELDNKAERLLKDAPEDLKPRVQEVSDGLDRVQGEARTLATNLAAAQQKNDELQAHLTVTDSHVIALETSQQTYYDEALTLADRATDERNARIGAEKKLSWYRWHFWLSWIVAGAGVAVCIVLAILKATGRLALTAGKFAL